MTARLQTQCPRFCDGMHHEKYRVHSRTVARLVNEFNGDQVEVEIKQYNDAAPVVSVTLSQDNEDVITQLQPNAAEALADAYAALGQGGTLTDALREASDVLDDALTHPGISIVEQPDDDGCAACRANDCDQCPTPRGSRLTADDQELPTCCCGRRFISAKRCAEPAVDLERLERDQEAGRLRRSSVER